MADIVMPRLSDTMEEGTILRWLKDDGEMVARGEELVEIETDKATMTYESDQAGVVQIVAAEGATLAVGAVIAHVGGLDEAGTDTASATAWATSRMRSRRVRRPTACRSSARWSDMVSGARCTRTRRSPTSANRGRDLACRRAWSLRSSR